MVGRNKVYVREAYGIVRRGSEGYVDGYVVVDGDVCAILIIGNGLYVVPIFILKVIS